MTDAAGGFQRQSIWAAPAESRCTRRHVKLVVPTPVSKASAMFVVISFCVLVPSVLLAWSGGVHVRDLGRFHAQVAAHDLVPFRYTRTAALTFGAIELLAGAAGLSAIPSVLAASDLWIVIASVSVGAVYAAIAMYVGLLVVRGSSVECGCFGRSEPVSLWTVSRALALGMAAFGGAVATVDGTSGAFMAVVALGLAASCQAAIARPTTEAQLR